jgi:N-acetylmuramic acid 6-phosphate etherase
MPSHLLRVLGIDGGGTKTDWVLVENGVSTAHGRLPPANLRLIEDDALRALFSALPREIEAAGIYLAGCATPADRARVEALARQIWPRAELRIGSDRECALAAAFRERDGIVVIAGTGAAVHGRRGGRIEKAGGWGHVVGDRGSGYDLARQALRRVLTRFDIEQAITPLGERILADLALNSLADLAAWAVNADKMSIARLAPAVFAAARQGDFGTLEVIEGGASVLADFTRAVAARLEWVDPEVRLYGGLFTTHPDYLALFTLRLSVLLPRARVSTCTDNGAEGAAWLAAGSHIGEGRWPAVTALIPARAEDLARAATEQPHPGSAHLDEMATPELVDLFIEEEKAVQAALAACRAPLIEAVDLVGNAMLEGGRLFYVGAGTSGRLGVLDASEIPPTFGTVPTLVQGIIAGGPAALHRAVEGAEDSVEAGALAVRERGCRRGDVVCGLSASGRTPFVLGALDAARELGAHTLFITSNPERARAGCMIEIDIPTGPEIIAGSTRLKAGTATKCVLNLLSSAAMIRLGRVQGNRMIDLGISNEKLRDRGARIVAETLGIAYPDALARLAAAGWNIRDCLAAGREGR